FESASVALRPRNGPSAVGRLVRPHLVHQLRHGILDGYRRVELAGGELLLDERWPKVVGLARDLGFGEVVVETNGRMLNLPGTLRQLVKLGLHGVVVRLNSGDEAVHDEMARVRGAFRQSVRGILQLRKHGVPFWLRIVEHPMNLDSIRAGEELADKLGARGLEIIS
ncbi:MAG: radical SAM protein, partial [Proteobacteria bacterium]|nr:radical SAM protein [Pseudomonadota bacterium]